MKTSLPLASLHRSMLGPLLDYIGLIRRSALDTRARLHLA